MDAKLKQLLKKASFFIISLSLGWWLVKSGYLQGLLDSIVPFKVFAEVTAGVFYTSFLTSPLSVGMLFVLAKDNNPIMTALLAGVGAVIGDIIILKFFKSKEVSQDINIVSRQLQLKKISNFLKRFRLDFFIPAIGVIIVASPFPDELGLMMLGASNFRFRDIVIITYILNTAGILLLLIPINLFL